MLVKQAESYCQELLKISQQGMGQKNNIGMKEPNPERPGRSYIGRLFGDTLLSTLGATTGYGLTQLGMKRLKNKPRIANLDRKIKEPIEHLGPVLAAGLGASLSSTANEYRKQRLREAVKKDKERRKNKTSEYDTNKSGQGIYNKS